MNDLRISYIDQLKGIAILLVVLGHVIGYNNCEDSFLWRFIYSFHMPLFMFISGYVAQMTFRIERFGWNETISLSNKEVEDIVTSHGYLGSCYPFLFLKDNDRSKLYRLCIELCENMGRGIVVLCYSVHSLYSFFCL